MPLREGGGDGGKGLANKKKILGVHALYTLKNSYLYSFTFYLCTEYRYSLKTWKKTGLFLKKV